MSCYEAATLQYKNTVSKQCEHNLITLIQHLLQYYLNLVRVLLKVRRMQFLV